MKTPNTLRLALACLMCLTLLPVGAAASGEPLEDAAGAEPVQMASETLIQDGAATPSGQCGDDAYWTLSEDGVLTITGTGQTRQVSWWSYRSGIKAIVIDEGITGIGDYSFNYIYSLTYVSLPSTLETIGNYAFAWNYALKEISIPEGVTSIGEGAFFSCESLEQVAVSSTVTAIGDDAFYGTPWYDSQQGDENGFFIINNILMLYLGENSDVEVPQGVTAIGGHAFSKSKAITSVTLPDTVMTIGAYAFSGCRNLTSVNIPAGVTYIDQCVFLESGVRYLTILNASCEIAQDAETLGQSGQTSLYGYAGSTTQAYAQRYGYDFVELSDTERGDVNGDGTISLKDVKKLFQYVNGQTEALDNMEAADINGDGAVDLKDVTKLFQYVNGQITELVDSEK
jgi:hypothetical protein